MEIFDDVFLTPALNAGCEYSFTSGLKLEAAARLYFENPVGDGFGIFAGILKYETDFPGETVDFSLIIENGAYVGWSTKTGILGYEAVVNPSSGFLNGCVNLTFQSDADPEASYESPDFMMEYALDLLCFEKQLRLMFPGRNDSGFEILPYLDYCYGDAVNDFQSTERQIRLVQLAAGAELGYRHSSILPFLQLFAGCSVGARLEKYWDFTESVDYTPAFLIHPQAGFRTSPVFLFPRSGLFEQNVKYGLTGSFGYQMMPFSDVSIAYQPRLTIGLNLWCDLSAIYK